MLQVSKCIPQGHGLAPVLLKRAATIELDWDVRQKSRFDTTDSQGRQIGTDRRFNRMRPSIAPRKRHQAG